MFVRPTQLVLLDDGGNPIEMQSPEEKQPRSRLSRYIVYKTSFFFLLNFVEKTHTFLAEKNHTHTKKSIGSFNLAQFHLSFLKQNYQKFAQFFILTSLERRNFSFFFIFKQNNF